MAATRSTSICVSAAALVLLLVASQATAARASLGAAAASRQLLQDKQQQCFDAFNQYGEWFRPLHLLQHALSCWFAQHPWRSSEAASMQHTRNMYSRLTCQCG
jgi:hypothetical protein